MAANKFYQVEKEIGGVKYIAQFGGISMALRAVDQSYIEGTSNTSVEKLAEFLFAHVIVEPKGLTVDDFDSMEDFNEVVKFANGVMKGDFRAQAVGSEAEKAGGK